MSQSEVSEKGYEALISEKGVNINEYLSEGSEFIQLQHGKNTITYTADEGIDVYKRQIPLVQKSAERKMHIAWPTVLSLIHI